MYQVLTDPSAKRSGFLRVIDESKEDYLYPESYFAAIDLPTQVKKALLARSAAVTPNNAFEPAPKCNAAIRGSSRRGAAQRGR